MSISTTGPASEDLLHRLDAREWFDGPRADCA